MLLVQVLVLLYGPVDAFVSIGGKKRKKKQRLCTS